MASQIKFKKESWRVKVKLLNHSILINFKNNKIYNLEHNEVKIIKECIIDTIKKEYPKNTFNF